MDPRDLSRPRRRARRPRQGTLRALIELVAATGRAHPRATSTGSGTTSRSRSPTTGRCPTSATCSGRCRSASRTRRGQRVSVGAHDLLPAAQGHACRARRADPRHRRSRRRGRRSLPPPRPHPSPARSGSARARRPRHPHPARRHRRPALAAHLGHCRRAVRRPRPHARRPPPRGRNGRYNIPKINFHLYRRQAFAVRLATPFDLGGRRFTFDPSGRDIDLFQPRQRPDEGEPWRPVREWEVPAPLTCRRLNAAWFLPAADDVPDDLFDELAPYAGLEFRTESGVPPPADRPAERRPAHPAPFEPARSRADPYLAEVPPLAGRGLAGVAASAGAPPLLRHEALGADLATWGAGVTVEADRRALIDPARGRSC